MAIDLKEYRRLWDDAEGFKEFLPSAPDLSLLEIDRPANPARTVDLDTDA